ncbi:MAG: carboxypeptidase-like regulatory domain-containing protein, partial [Bacteroides sp.]|nr:carboxypeptidase-like regulatory domain-containing protein [Bacteroides sp.]
MKNFIITLLMLVGFSTAVCAQESITVTGTVTDTKGEPMIGVNITVKDVPGLGTITDIDGQYRIKMDAYNRLIFTYIGFESVEIQVKDQRVVDVKMVEAEASVLDELVVTGMGAQKKITVTGAVTNVDVGSLKRYS